MALSFFSIKIVGRTSIVRWKDFIEEEVAAQRRERSPRYPRHDKPVHQCDQRDRSLRGEERHWRGDGLSARNVQSLSSWKVGVRSSPWWTCSNGAPTSLIYFRDQFLLEQRASKFRWLALNYFHLTLIAALDVFGQLWIKCFALNHLKIFHAHEPRKIHTAYISRCPVRLCLQGTKPNRII